MSKIIIQESENGIYVKVGSKLNRFYRKGELQASNGASSNEISIQDTVDNFFVCKNFPYSEVIKPDASAWGGTRAATVTNLNNVINATPETYIKDSDKVTALDGVTGSDFTGKTGYTVIVGQSDESLSTSGKLLFTAADIKLGDDLNVQNYSIYTSTTNADIQLTPNGTGSINLDGTVKFKRFDAGATPPSAFVGGMYANDDDELFFGVTGA